MSQAEDLRPGESVGTSVHPADEDNRDGDEFTCQKCGKELHADYTGRRKP